jgi:hypothetical protein
MPIEAKSTRKTTPDLLNELPDVPRFPTLTPEEQAALDTWWVQVQEVLTRKYDSL